MEEQQWRSESVALDAPPTVQTTTVPAPKMPVGKQIPWKWVFGAGILVVALVAGLLFLRSNLAKNQEPTNNGQVKTQNVDLGKLAKNTTPLTLDKTDRVVINGQLQTTQGLVINPTAEPTTSVLGQVYLDSTTGDLRYYNGTTYLTIANSDAVGLTEVEVLALLTAFGTKLPQDLATTASPLFGGLKLSGTNGNAVLLQAAAGTANVTLTLPANGGAISQCLTTDGAGTLSFSACASGSGNALLQGGNAFATAVVLGTTDNNALNIITNNTTRLTVLATGNVGIGNGAPDYKLDVDGDINSSTGIRVGGALLCSASGCVAASGSNNYIQNSLNLQVANFHISSVDANSVTGIIRAIPLQTADLLQLKDLNGTNLVSVGSTGNTLIKPSSDATFAFSVQNALGTSLLIGADTIMSRVAVARALPANYTLDVGGDINTSTGLRVGNVLVCTLLSGCTAAAGSGSYIQNGTATQTASFDIQSAINTDVVASIRGASGQSANLLEVVGIGALNVSLPIATFGSSGAILLQNAIDSTTAFQVKDLAGTALLTVDTSGSNLTIAASNSLFKAATNSTTAFQVQNAAGNNYLLVNTSGASISVGDAGIASTIQIGNTTGAVAQTVNIGNNTTASSTTTTTVGSKIGTSPTKIQAGTSGVVVQAADSVNAFSVQNAAGTATLFNIDTTNSVIKINGNNSGTLQAWANTTSLGSLWNQHATVSNGSYLYRVAGYNGVSLQASVSYAPINPNGTVGAWAATSPLGGTNPERGLPGAVISNGYMYVVGGRDSTTAVTTTIYYGAINSDGTISSWKLADNKMVTAVLSPGVVVHNGYIYIIGGATTAYYGYPGTPTNSVQYAKLNADGSVGSFCVSGSTCTSPLTAPPALTDARMGGQAIVSNGYLYYVSGENSSNVGQKDIYRTLINSDGSLGAWTKLTGVLTTARGYVGVGVLNGYLYAVGGSGQLNSYEYAQIGASGSLGAFTQISSTLTTGSASLGMATANGYFYIVSGSNSGEVQYTSGPRTYVGGSLDLVGLGGNGLQSSSGGGTLTAGNTIIAGRFRVTDAATFMQGVSINGDISGSGQAVFRSTTNSATAFQIQNSSGESVLIADTVNNIILPGLVASSTATLQKYSTLAVGSMYRTGLNAFLSYTGYPTLSFGDTLYNRIGVIQCVSYDCANPTVPSPVYIGKPNGAAISIVDTANYDGVKLSNNNPLYVWRTSAASTQGIWYQRCGTYDCSSGNSDTKYVTAGAANTSCYGMQVTTTLLSNNFPMFLSHGTGVSTCGTKVWAMVCGDVKCDTSPTSKTQIGTQSGSDGLAVGMTYCSDALRLQTSGANMCPLVVHNTTSPSSGFEISLCNTTCSSSTSAHFTVSPAVAIQSGSNARPIQVVILGNGLPVIARQNISNNIEIIHCKSLLCTTYDYNIVGTTSTSKGFSLILGSYNGQSLPQIVFNDQSTASMKFIQCKTDTCDPASNIVTVLNGAGGLVSVPTPEPVASMIGNDGLPLIFSQGSATLLQVTHCVDLYCAALSGTQSSGGVLLGSKPNAFQGLYVSSINDGSQSSGFQYTNNGLVVANYLTSDKIGNVLISSATSTALQVTSLSSSAIALSVDAASSSVNIGTATTVVGYGFNSAAASLFRNDTNSTSAFNIQNASGASLFSADTSGGNVNVTQGNFVINNFTTPSTPTTGTISNSSGSLSGAASTYYYKVTSVGVGGESAPSAELSVPLTPLTAPTALTATASVTAGNVTCNATGCNYKVTFVTANGETDGGTISNTLVNVSSKQITLTAIPLGGSGTTSRKIYRSTNGGAFLLDQTIANNTSTTATDNITTPSGAIPASNTARTNLNSLSINFTAVTGAGSYNFYRSTSSGAELKCTVTAPTTITSSPATDDGTWTCGGTAASSVTGFGSKVGIGINAPTTSLDVRGNALFKNQTDTTTAFQIQNAAGNTILGADTALGLVIVGNETNAFYATLDSSGLSANRAITFPDSDGAICLTSGNCLGSGGGGGVGSSGGTANYLPKFTAAYNLENSILQETGGITILNEAGGFASGKASTTTGSLLFYNSTNANTITLQSGATAANLVLTLPTTAGSNGDCLQTNGTGTLSFGGCTGGAGGGVTSIAGQTGVVTVNNATGSGGVLTIDNASTSAKGIASFNSTNFSVSSGAVNTIQDINTGATPQFAGVLANSLDRAAAGTLTIGGSTQTAISLGRTGITTTNAGALTVSQTLTANGTGTGLSVTNNAQISGTLGLGVAPSSVMGINLKKTTTCALGCYGILSELTTTGSGAIASAYYGKVVSGGALQANGLSIGTSTTTGTITDNYGIIVDEQTAGTNDYGVAIGAADTQTLWINNTANSTTAAGGIAFGSSRDTTLFRSAANTLAIGDTSGSATVKISPTTITSSGTTTAATPGSALTISSGTGNTSGAGGLLTLRAGTGGTSGIGGAVAITGGAAGGNTKAGGNITLTTGAGLTSGDGGAFSVQGGAGGTTGIGGALGFTAGAGGTNGTNGTIGGGITLTAGVGGTSIAAGTSGAGGAISLTGGMAGAGSATSGGVGGAILLTGGNGNYLNSGGAVSLQAGTGGQLNTGATVSAGAGQWASAGDLGLIAGNQVYGGAGGYGSRGGNVNLTSGNNTATNTTVTNFAGNISITAGNATGSLAGVVNQGGNITMTAGNASGALSTTLTGGSLTLDAGTGTTTNGSINIGTANALTTTIGRITGTATTLIQGGNGTGASAAIRLIPQAAGDILIGGSTQTGAITVGNSTDSNTINIGTGVTASAKTLTIYIGNSGAAGSTTNITIGSPIAGTLTVKSVATFEKAITIGGHVLSSNTSGSTTIAAGAAACTTPTVMTVTGNDTAGLISVTTGTGCAATGILATVTFASAYGVAPKVIFTPTSATGTALTYFNGASSTSTFTLNTNTIPTNATSYTYNYFVIQ